MRILVLAEAPFRDLRSAAILAGLGGRFGAGTPLLLAGGGSACPPGFEPVAAHPDPRALRVARVVIAGVFGERVSLERALQIAGGALAHGARVETHGFAVERDAARREMPAARAVLDAAVELEVRDYHTANALLVWRVAAPIRISAYAERNVPPDTAFAASLPSGPLLGLGILGGGEVGSAVTKNAGVLRQILASAQGWPVVPLPAEAPGSPMDDHAGARAFAAAILPGNPWLLPELDDPARRGADLSPSRLKALAARCALVVTDQDVVAGHAIAAGVPVLGLALGPDRRIISCFASLANKLPQGSDLIYPERWRSPPASSSARA